ncbi:glycosyltransferase family 2 protein [Filimonas effusa]|uniref:Glycosyltransferase family 2 protein n=1 Tax=Filimonas effusa TaxID=2508721 RepID=A0A4Q1D3D0_9BACT|nr:glycosyltransferase family A protein [Filimonas effusa]RXK81809.1 glycosyltransferase family 2 protein [Filimonas effusa]
MSLFRLPGWIHQHLYPGRTYENLSEQEILDLKQRLSGFGHNSPDVSVMIPAWNEQDNIFRALSSLASNQTKYKVEIVVINNNSTDATQELLDKLGVVSYFQPEQGITHARQMGLNKAKGKYHLCADSDTLYPPHWIDTMVAPLTRDNGVVGVYGRYGFIPSPGEGRFLFFFYEKLTGLLIRLRKKNQEFVNVLGFNMGFITANGRNGSGFAVVQARKFDNARGEDYVEESEDGRMAVSLMKQGQLKLVTDNKARVFTSSRRITSEGGLLKSFSAKAKLHMNRMSEYLRSRKS